LLLNASPRGQAGNEIWDFHKAAAAADASLLRAFQKCGPYKKGEPKLPDQSDRGDINYIEARVC
jgi:hypothetical protein